MKYGSFYILSACPKRKDKYKIHIISLAICAKRYGCKQTLWMIQLYTQAQIKLKEQHLYCYILHLSTEISITHTFTLKSVRNGPQSAAAWYYNTNQFYLCHPIHQICAYLSFWLNLECRIIFPRCGIINIHLFAVSNIHYFISCLLVIYFSDVFK